MMKDMTVPEQRELIDGIELWGNAQVCKALGVFPSNIDKVAGLPAPAKVTPTGRLWLADEIREFAADRAARHRDG